MMNANVYNLINDYIKKTKDLLHQEIYFVKSCYKFPDKFSLTSSIIDTQLQLKFDEYNQIVLGGKCVRYYTDQSRTKVKLTKITLDTEPYNINNINNYIVEDTWDQIDW